MIGDARGHSALAILKTPIQTITMSNTKATLGTPLREMTLEQLEAAIAQKKKEAKERDRVPAAECITKGYRHLAYAVLECRKAGDKNEGKILEAIQTLADLLQGYKYPLPKMQASKAEGKMNDLPLIPLTK